MSTNATVTDMAVKPETITFALIGSQVKTGVDTEGNPTYKTEYKAASADKTIDEARKAGTISFEQTFSFDKAGTVAGINQVIKDDEEATAIFNAGLKVKLNNKVKQLLEATDETTGDPTFEPVEGTFDLRDLLNEAAQRRNLSPVDKAIKTLSGLGLSPEALAALVGQLRVQVGQAPATAAE